MTQKLVTIIITGIILTAFGISLLFIFGSHTFEKGMLCFSSNVIDPQFFYSVDVPYLIFLTLVMFYTFYAYFIILKKTQPEVSTQGKTLKVKKSGLAWLGSEYIGLIG